MHFNDDFDDARLIYKQIFNIINMACRLKL